MNMLKISIVIPAFNESQRLPYYLDSICNYIQKNTDFIYEVIVVNDGSTDRTFEITSSYIKRFDFINIISLNKNMGKGFAIKTGIAHSNGDYILFADADGATPISELDKFKPFLQNNYKGMLISRRNIQKKERTSFFKIIIRKLARLIYNKIRKAILLSYSQDSQCGFKILSSDLKEYFIALQRQYRYSFDTEYLIITNNLNKDIKELDTIWISKAGSKVSIVKDSIKMFYDLLKIKMDLIRGLYDPDSKETLKDLELSKIRNSIDYEKSSERFFNKA